MSRKTYILEMTSKEVELLAEVVSDQTEPEIQRLRDKINLLALQIRLKVRPKKQSPPQLLGAAPTSDTPAKPFSVKDYEDLPLREVPTKQ